jgi:hypothetical protein
MNPNRKFTIFTAVVLAQFLLFAAVPCRAQGTPLEAEGVGSTSTPDGASTSQTPAPGPAVPDSAQPSSPADDGGWHVSLSPYGWFPGLHGNFVARGNGLSVSASAIDLLSNARFGLMGVVEGRYKRLVLPVDVVWGKFGANKALPFPILSETSASLKATMLILSPKVGYRLLDQKAFKIDALVGIRYWYFGENLRFIPSRTGLNFSGAQEWVDPVVGGRIQAALSPKIVATVFGNVGGWGTGSQLEYEAGGLLGFKIKPAWTLQAGYRYLFTDYRTNGGLTVVNMVLSGIVIGATVNLK